MKVMDQAAWDRVVEINSDPYSAGCIRYAERWADLMEAELAQGAQLEDVAKRTSHEADTEGITLFMYGAAISELAQHWEHGEILRRWHNRSVQMHDEGERANESGGVLNPAIISTEGTTGRDEYRHVPEELERED